MQAVKYFVSFICLCLSVIICVELDGLISIGKLDL